MEDAADEFGFGEGRVATSLPKLNHPKQNKKIIFDKNKRIGPRPGGEEEGEEGKLETSLGEEGGGNPTPKAFFLFVNVFSGPNPWLFYC